MNSRNHLLLFIALVGVGIIGALYYQSTIKQLVIRMDQLKDRKNIVPIVVIGSGPAGFSAGLYGARAGLYTVIFEGMKPGGQLTETTYVENWPGIPKMLGTKIMDQSRKQAQAMGALTVNDTIAEVDFSTWPYILKTEEGHEIAALSVIIATGSYPRMLSHFETVPGEVEYWGNGVTSCAICDAPFYKDKKVVVIGGGDSAVEEATLLTSYASSVTMLVRGKAMRAAASMQARLKDYPKIKVLYTTKVTEVLGDGTSVTGVRVFDTDKKDCAIIETDGVFLAIGHEPTTKLFKKWLRLDTTGYIILKGCTQDTSLPGIFAAGDVADPTYKQAGVAAGNGIKAALGAIEFLQEHGFTPKIAAKLESSYFDSTPEEDLKPLPKIVTNANFDDLANKHQWIVLEVGGEQCSGCAALQPVVQSVAAKLSEKAYFTYIDLDDDPKELIKRFSLKAIPTILVFKKGEMAGRYDQQLFSKRELYRVLNVLIEQ